MNPPLILASSSPYRKELLARLQLAFDCYSPDIDESPLPREVPQDLVQRLARAKAQALAARFPVHLIIGSDQVAELQGHILTKPHSVERAQEQLARCSGKTVDFWTGLCVLDSGSGRDRVALERFRVQFRPLSAQQIRHYVQRERPLDCAGSFKMEGLGIALFERLEGRDPNSLIGLPLIALVDLLSHFGVEVLASH